jgi:hypothetical protein
MGALQSFAIFVILVIAAKIAWTIKDRVKDKYPELYKAIRAKAPEVMKLLTGMFQILGGYATILYRVPWPPAFSRISRLMGVVNLDLFAIPSIRCTSYGKTFFTRFDMHMTSMLGVTALLVLLLLYAYSKMNKATYRVPRALVWNLLLPFLFIIYPSVSKTAILMLRCRTVNGHSYLLSDIALSCETAEYRSHFVYAIFCVMVFPVGIIVFFMALVWFQRDKLPPDWWPAEEKAKCKERYDEYRKQHGRNKAKVFPDWKVEVWDAEMAHHVKFYNRFGFLFGAYNRAFWWFESLITLYKLAMTVLILFVSDQDEPKILLGMLIATLMLGIFAFYQPFKNPDLLSINAGVQMVVLMVLFTAQYLIFSDGGDWYSTLILIAMVFTPLVAGICMILRVSEKSYVPDSDTSFAELGENTRPAIKPSHEDESEHSLSSILSKSSRSHTRSHTGGQLDDSEPAVPDVARFFKEKVTDFSGNNPLYQSTGQGAEARRKAREAQKAERASVRKSDNPHAAGATNPMHSANPAVTEQAAGKPSAVKKKTSVFQNLTGSLARKRGQGASVEQQVGAGRPANKRLGGVAGSKQESFMVPVKQMSHKSFDLADVVTPSESRALPALSEDGNSSEKESEVMPNALSVSPRGPHTEKVKWLPPGDLGDDWDCEFAYC